MKVLVFQHVAVEHPGVFRDLLGADGIAWDTVELDERQPIPDFEGYDGLMVFGGPMDVWQEQQYRWLKEEKAAIRRWVLQKRRPYLGVCLGHQLLADALGGSVGLMEKPEVGVLDIKLTPAGVAAPLFRDVPSVFPALQWHSAQVTRLPANAHTLATNEYCSVQSFVFGHNAYGIQCHVEQTDCTVSEWGEIDEYRRALETMMGSSGRSQMEMAVAQNMQAFRDTAKTIYRNFRDLMS